MSETYEDYNRVSLDGDLVVVVVVVVCVGGLFVLLVDFAFVK